MQCFALIFLYYNTLSKKVSVLFYLRLFANKAIVNTSSFLIKAPCMVQVTCSLLKHSGC
jgi:hypothetical protein